MTTCCFTGGRRRYPLLAGPVALLAAGLLLAGCATAAVPVRRPAGPAAGTSAGPATSSGAAAPGSSGAPGGSAGPLAGAAPAPWTDPVTGPGYLAAGSDPAALPADLMIADKKNNRLVIVDPRGRVRWQFPRPGDLAAGQEFRIPDDAFFSPDGKQIIATEEDYFAIRVIDIATHRIVYQYGTPGHAGSTVEHLNNPDDAMLLADGSILSPDIKNCRILLLAPGATAPTTIFGRTGTCRHAPPATFGSPNGAFPISDGNLLVTEINGSWVSEMTLAGQVLWSTHVPGVAYPSDTNQVGPDRYLSVDYATVGQVVMFNQAGQSLWRYTGTGAGRLNHPSLALPLPNGNVIVNDDYNHRVVVIDPRTNTIVWQYGHTGVPGAGPGYLNNPDGMDLVAPYTLVGTHPVTGTRP